MVVPPYLGANNISKYSCEFFQRNTHPEYNFGKYGEISQVLVEEPWFAQSFRKNSPEIVLSLNSTYESPLNLGKNATNFRSNG